MKIILTGATGWVGSHVLQEAISNPNITKIVALSRRALSANIPSHKLKVVLVEDFLKYSQEVVDEIRSADGCIWCMGTYNWNPVVEVDYPETFQRTLSQELNRKSTFRYIYLGGAFTVQDQGKSLWLFAKGRKVRGLAEKKLLDFGKNMDNVKVRVVKPGGILHNNAVGYLTSQIIPASIRVDILAKAMVDLAISGGNGNLVSNQEIVERGRNLHNDD